MTLTAKEIKECQKLFDTSLAHVRKQGTPSYDRNTQQCMYRMGDLSCAAAPFIKKYNSKMETGCWSAVADTWRRNIIPAAFKHSDFVDSLQYCHDSAAGSTNSDEEFLQIYEGYMEELASQNGLAYTAP